MRGRSVRGNRLPKLLIPPRIPFNFSLRNERQLGNGPSQGLLPQRPSLQIAPKLSLPSKWAAQAALLYGIVNFGTFEESRNVTGVAEQARTTQVAQTIPSQPEPMKTAGFNPFAAVALWLTRRFRRSDSAQQTGRQIFNYVSYGRFDVETNNKRAEAIGLADVVKFESDGKVSIQLVDARHVQFDIQRGGDNSVVDHVISVADPRISRRHARVAYSNGTHTLDIADTSKNGTTVIVGGKPPQYTRDRSIRIDVSGESVALIKCGLTTFAVYFSDTRTNPLNVFMGYLANNRIPAPRLSEPANFVREATSEFIERE